MCLKWLYEDKQYDVDDHWNPSPTMISMRF